MYNKLESKLYQHSAIKTVMEEMKKKLTLRVGHGKATNPRLLRVRPTNSMEGDNAVASVPIGANEHELIKLGTIR